MSIREDRGLPPSPINPPIGYVIEDGTSHIVYQLCALVPGRTAEESLTTVYVGVTSHYHKRMRQHSRKWWWKAVDHDSTCLQVFAARADADAYEKWMIRVEQPAMNRAGRLLVVTGV